MAIQLKSLYFIIINMDDQQNNEESEFQSSDSQNHQRQKSKERNTKNLKYVEEKYKKLSLKQEQQKPLQNQLKRASKHLKQEKSKKERITEKKKMKEQQILKQKQQRALIQQQINMYVFENAFEQISQAFTSYFIHIKTMSSTTYKILTKIQISNKTLQQLNLYNQFYKNMIRSIFLKVYRDFLKKKTYKFQIMKNVWDKMIKQYLSLSISTRQLVEDKEQILFLLFQLKPAQIQTVFRELVIRNLLENSFLKYQKQHVIMDHMFKIYKSSLAILTIRPSFVYFNEGFITQLNEVVSIVKKSWFVKHLFKVFLQGRQDMMYLPLFLGDDQQKANQTIQEAIQECLKNIQIYFIDYANVQQSGIFYTGDQKKDPIIFINTYSESDKRNRLNIEIIKGYVMVNLLHQFLIAIIKKNFRDAHENAYQIFETILLDENSDYRKEFEGSFKIAGLLFENFAFGGHVIYFTDKDYQSVKMLLQCQKNPFPGEVEWNLFRPQNESNNYLLKLQQLLKFRESHAQDYHQIETISGDMEQIQHSEERSKQIIQIQSELGKLLESNKRIFLSLKRIQFAQAEKELNENQIIQKIYEMYEGLAFKQNIWNSYFQAYILKIRRQIEQSDQMKFNLKGKKDNVVSSNIKEGQQNIEKIKKMIQVFRNLGSQQREKKMQQKGVRFFTRIRQVQGIRIIKNRGCGTPYAKRAALY